MRLSNLDLVISYVFKGENTASSVAASSKVKGDILVPALSNAQVSLLLYSLSVVLTVDISII